MECIPFNAFLLCLVGERKRCSPGWYMARLARRLHFDNYTKSRVNYMTANLHIYCTMMDGDNNESIYVYCEKP